MQSNDAVYRSARVVEVFKQAARAGLTLPEKYCLTFIPDFRRHSVLDIGVGTGRTTPPLSMLFKEYLGVDRSHEMIAAAKTLYPTADLRTMDARKLEVTQQFDCVMFSFNGIDYVDYSTRQTILQRDFVSSCGRKAIYISTHNLHNREVASWLKYLIVRELVHPLGNLLSPAGLRAVTHRLFNFWRQSGNQSQTFAYVNDSGEGIHSGDDIRRHSGEIKTLERHGFKVIATIGNNKQLARI